MSNKRDQLIRRHYEVIESSSQLRTQLLDFEKAMLKIANRLEGGEPAVSAGHGIGAPGHRQRVTEALSQFEGSRHQLRLALFALALEEGASMAEVGRVLGISRQLASRIAAEATRND
jgi:hypothetical protein